MEEDEKKHLTKTTNAVLKSLQIDSEEIEVLQYGIAKGAFGEVRHCEERSDELGLRYFATAKSEATVIKNIVN